MCTRRANDSRDSSNRGFLDIWKSHGVDKHSEMERKTEVLTSPITDGEEKCLLHDWHGMIS